MAARKTKASKFVGDAGDFKKISNEEFERRGAQRAAEIRAQEEAAKAKSDR